jgi:D-sedoheptulose 7-phosphate isomerase
MELEERVIANFNASANARTQCSQALAPLIADASGIIVQCLLNEGKILICANGQSANTAEHFCNCLLNQYEQERPSLPAIALTGQGAVLTGIAEHNTVNEIFSKQLRALGQPGDVLVIISPDGNNSNLIQATKAAHDRQMIILALTADDGGHLASLLGNDDLEIRVPFALPNLVHEIHLSTVFCLCDLIEAQLFGNIT